MVSNPVFRYRPAQAPRDFGTLVQSTFALWLASLRSGFWPGMGYALLSQLAFLPWSWQTPDISRDVTPGSFLPDAWVMLLFIVTNLLALVFLLVLMRRQGLLTRGVEETPDRSVAVSIRRFFPSLLAMLGYFALNLAALAPLFIAWWLGSASGDAVTLLAYLLAGLLLCAAPLGWVSVAATFHSLPILLEGSGPWAALRESFRLVRGHWILSATLLSLTWLMWMGIYGTVGTVPWVLAGIIAYALDGFAGLLRMDWMMWGNYASAPLVALTLPLLTAGYAECFQELRLRAGATPVSA